MYKKDKSNKSKKFKKGDNVIVIAGRSTGTIGEITKVFTDDNKFLVSGVNLVTVHKKATSTDAGGKIRKESPIHVSNVSHIDKSNKPTKIRFEILPDGKKVRIAKTSGDIIG